MLSQTLIVWTTNAVPPMLYMVRPELCISSIYVYCWFPEGIRRTNIVCRLVIAVRIWGSKECAVAQSFTTSALLCICHVQQFSCNFWYTIKSMIENCIFGSIQTWVTVQNLREIMFDQVKNKESCCNFKATGFRLNSITNHWQPITLHYSR